MPHYTRFSYASTSTALPSTIREHLTTIIKDAENNTARGEMAGILIYGNDYFFHCIEAPASYIDSIYQEAIQNPLDTSFKLLRRELISERWFRGWEIKYFLREEPIRQFFSRYQSENFNPYILEGPVLDEFLHLLADSQGLPSNHPEEIGPLSRSSGQMINPYYIGFMLMAALLVLLIYLLDHYIGWGATQVFSQ